MLTLKVIITAGGLSEPIDSVRSITNYSTGELGSLIADELIASGVDVTYICSSLARRPAGECRQIVANTAREALKAVTSALEAEQFDWFVHSMAVSDYEVESVVPAPVDGKMSSDVESPVIRLRQTPKIIAQIKQIQPQIRLVGFKLLAGIDLSELFAAAENLAKKNSCEFVIANCKEDISPQKHIAYLVSPEGENCQFRSKIEIAKAITTRVLEAHS